jgi:hypothetical protein
MNRPDRNSAITFSLLIGFLLLAFLPFFFSTNEQMLPHIRENGFYQLLTAIAFLICSVVLMLSYFVRNNGNNFGRFQTRRNIFVLLLAIVFFIGSGEELSWGQHILQFETPESIAQKNLQGEFNIHNLALVHGRTADGSKKTGLSEYLTIGKLFSLFWFAFCVCIPLLALVSTKIRHFLAVINLPIVPLYIGLAFPINHILQKIVVPLTGATEHYVVEVKEANFAVLFLVFAAFYYIGLKRKAIGTS